MNIKRLRQKRKLTQAELASRVNIHRVSLVRIETGAIMPTLATLERIARALKVKPGALFDG